MVQGRIDNNTQCGRCRGRIITTSESESVCSKCGWVVVDRVEDMATDYDVTRDGRGGRTGPPTNIAFDNASSSIIGRVNKDAGGNSLTSANKQTIDRLRQWDSRSQVSNSKSRNYLKAFSELSNMCNKLSIPTAVKERAAIIYRDAVDQKLIRGRTINTLVAASLYLAVRETLTPRSLKDIANEAGVNLKDISANYRMLVTEMNLTLPIIHPKAFTTKIATNCEPSLPMKVVNIANKLIEEAEKRMVSHGKDPIGFSASCLYLATKAVVGLTNDNNYSSTQRNIAEAANVTEVTVRNRCKDLVPIAIELWPDAFASEVNKKPLK